MVQSWNFYTVEDADGKKYSAMLPVCGLKRAQAYLGTKAKVISSGANSNLPLFDIFSAQDENSDDLDIDFMNEPV